MKTTYKIDDIIIDYTLLRHFDNEFLFKYFIIPISRLEYLSKVACLTKDSMLINLLEQKLKTNIEVIETPREKVLLELQNLSLKKQLFELIHSKQSNSSDNKIETFFEILFNYCIKTNVSDVHFEAKKDILTMRLRIDGSLIKFLNFDLNYLGIISSYIKLISNLDISQRRVPQNGRFSKTINSVQYDFRISTMPTINGESIVIRILTNETIDINIKNLGFEQDNLDLIKNVITHDHGLILVTGPTGSGKTTTLYAILNILNNISKKIITIEEPVEYKIDNIQQISINNDIGLDFLNVLKNVLRQDPDIIMIGEIRDKESLNIAIQAALTGHLVLATLHTNSSILTIDRMLDLGAEPFLISATLKAVIAQRLIRRLCHCCKQQIDNEYKSNGCQECNMLGFRGREIVSEVFVIDKEISSLLIKKQPSQYIEEIATKKQFKTMIENGMKKVAQGLITKKDLILATNN